MLAGYRIGRILTLALTLVVVVFIAFQIHDYLSTGKLTVTTNRNDGYIKLSGPDGQKIGGMKQSHKLSKRLKPGRYSIMTYAGSAYTNKVVTIKARQNISLSLELENPRSPEPVLSKPAISILASKDTLYFIDSSAGDLMKVDTQGRVANVSEESEAKGQSEHRLISARWLSPGVGVAMDDGHNLYALNNGSITKLALPFQVNNNPSIDFDIAGSNLYVSNGQDVYAGTLAGNFKKIYSSGNDYNSGLVAGKDGVAFIDKSSGGGLGSLVVVQGGKTLKIASDASQLAWSPDGNYVAAVGGKTDGVVYNNNLQVAYLLPNAAGEHALWQNDQSLIYSVGNIVWSFSLPGQQAKAIAALPANQSIGTAAISSDQNYLYFSENNRLARLGLNNQPDSKLVALSAFLPESVGVCSLDYVNFVKPVITISYPSLESSSSLCENVAKSQLRYFGLNPNGFQYTITPAPQSIPTDDDLNPN